MEQDFLSVALSHETEARKKKNQSEEEWVEAEIGRLLHHAEVDDEDEARSSPTSELQAVDERWKGDSCVGHVFSAYLSSLECRQSDEQDLISDAFSALNMATGSLAKRPDNSVKEVITDLTLTLSRLEQKENNTLDSVTIETYQIEEKGNTEGEAQLLKKSDSTTVEEVNLKQNVNSAYNEERRADFTSNEPREIVAVVEASPILEGSNASAEGISKRTTIGGSTDNNDSSRYDPARSRESGDLCDLELGPDELSDEVLAVFEQVRNDQRTCEEQLSSEQKKREAELTMEIEEAQRMIAEYQEAEIQRARVLEQARHRAAITLQAHWRCYSVKKINGSQLEDLKQQRLQRVYRSAQLLQSIWRGFATRKQYGPVLEVQRALRLKSLQKEAEVRNQCATRIQALWKGFRVRRIHGSALSALKQERLRETQRIREELNHKLNAKATIIQASWRGHYVRQTYTPLLRERMGIWREEMSHRRNLAATRLQAHWRGHCERQRVGQLLLEEKRKKKVLEEKRHRAACVVQAYWRMHCCRKQFLQYRKSKSSDVSEPSSAEGPKRSSRSPGRLSISRRLESALSLKSHNAAPVIHKQGTPCSQRNSNTTSTHQGFGITVENEQDEIVQPEQQALMALQISRERETFAAQQARIKMNQAMMHSEAERALQEKQSCASYQNELNHCSTPVAAQVWLDVVHQRLQQWFNSITPWKEPPLPITVGEPVPIPTARHQPVTKTLSRADLLAASPEETSPSRVEHVLLNELDFVPDVSSLSCCRQLCSLDIINCGLSSLSSLPSNVPLAALNLQGNNLEQIDLQSVGSTLKFLNLSENKLSSVHGLEGCSNLLDLDISGNRITRLGGLGCCWYLHKLSSDSNLLVGSVGLENLPYLQTLSCARNHLPVAPDVSHSSLLSVLHLQQNNLQEAPGLPHHVVLRELRLEDNSLTDVSPLCQAWLPLLQTLSLARNCITHLDSLLPLIMLNILDISNNSIYDLPMLLKALHGCMELRQVSLEGNPVAQEPQLLSHLISVLPHMDSMDDLPLYHPLPEKKFELPDLVTSSPVYQLCKRQLLEQDNMNKLHTETLNKTARSISQRTREFMETKVEQRKQFECLLIQHVKQQEELGQRSVRGPFEEKKMTQPAQECPLSEDTDRQVSAATVIQAGWRGRVTRTRVTAMHRAAVILQARWRGVLARRSLALMREQRRKFIWAATVIQAMYRGYWVRCKLRQVMQHAKYVSDEENSLEEDIDLNMNEEDLLGEDFAPFSPPTPVCPPITTATSSHPDTLSHLTPDNYHGLQNDSIREPVISHQGSESAASPEEEFNESGGRWSGVKESGENWGPPTHAWTEDDRRTSSAVSQGSLEGSPHPSSPISGKRVVKENIADEWGFKTDTTVNLLMKRARRQKMFKNKAAQRKRMADPAERLAAFQRKGHVVMANTDPGRSDQSHHWGQHTYQSHNSPMSSTKMYQWHHDHTVIHKDVEKCISGHLPRKQELKAKHEYTPSTSSCTLPQLDQRVLAGYAPTLVGRDSRGGSLDESYSSSQDYNRHFGH